jgi:hypothetical protein
MVELLTSEGHSFKEVMTYPLKRIYGLAELVMMRKKRELMIQASALRTANHAEDKDFKKYISSLE